VDVYTIIAGCVPKYNVPQLHVAVSGGRVNVPPMLYIQLHYQWTVFYLFFKIVPLDTNRRKNHIIIYRLSEITSPVLRMTPSKKKRLLKTEV